MSLVVKKFCDHELCTAVSFLVPGKHQQTQPIYTIPTKELELSFWPTVVGAKLGSSKLLIVKIHPELHLLVATHETE